MYDTKRYRNMSVVLNGVSDMGDGYGKYHYYKQGYRYSK
ncbi:unknown [Prevotella sp. CAG:1031]|nr:unknown [Prevotella sp. CAG:1031]